MSISGVFTVYCVECETVFHAQPAAPSPISAGASRSLFRGRHSCTTSKRAANTSSPLPSVGTIAVKLSWNREDRKTAFWMTALQAVKQALPSAFTGRSAPFRLSMHWAKQSTLVFPVTFAAIGKFVFHLIFAYYKSYTAPVGFICRVNAMFFSASIIRQEAVFCITKTLRDLKDPLSHKTYFTEGEDFSLTCLPKPMSHLLCEVPKHPLCTIRSKSNSDHPLVHRTIHVPEYHENGNEKLLQAITH